jgi:hypothetical protein
MQNVNKYKKLNVLYHTFYDNGTTAYVIQIRVRYI